MTTITRVPFNINAEAPTSGTFLIGDVVGGDAAMQTSDGDTSYAEVGSQGAFSGLETGHTFEWVGAVAIPPTARAYIQADWLTDDDAAFGIGYTDPTDGTGYTVAGTFATGSDVDTHPYGSPQTNEITGGHVEYGQAFLPGVQWQVFARPSGDFDAVTVAHITRLTLIIVTEADPHLRQRNRGTLRASRLADRGRSIRQRGFL